MVCVLCVSVMVCVLCVCQPLLVETKKAKRFNSPLRGLSVMISDGVCPVCVLAPAGGDEEGQAVQQPPQRPVSDDQ